MKYPSFYKQKAGFTPLEMIRVSHRQTSGSNKVSQTGFTLVELLIVIIVIGILATITYAGASAVIARSKQTEIQATLTGSRQKIEDYKKREGSYPQLSQLPAGTVPSNYQSNYFYDCGAVQCYCLEIKALVGLWLSAQQVNYHVSSVNNDPLTGDCSGFEQEVLGNGLGGKLVTGSSQYGTLNVEGKTPLKGSFYMSKTTTPPGYVSTALIRAAVYLNGTYTSSQSLSQYSNYTCSDCGISSWYIGSVTYDNSSAVVKIEWQDPANGWSELISVTLP